MKYLMFVTLLISFNLKAAEKRCYDCEMDNSEFTHVKGCYTDEVKMYENEDNPKCLEISLDEAGEED